MSEYMDPLELLWEQLLSREPTLIQKAFDGLSISEQGAVLAHLKRMTEEAGWHPEQRSSALSALEVLSKKDSELQE